MIVKSFANIMSLDHCKANIFGCDYEFILENFENVNGLARWLIRDLTNDETYHSNGYIEINGHSFTTKWKREYDYTRENFVHTHDLILEVV